MNLHRLVKGVLRAGLPLLIGTSVVIGCAPGSTASPDEDAERAIPSLEPVALAAGEKLTVVATTSIVGDVVGQVGGSAIELTVLMQPGQDPHSYEPAAADFALMQAADVVFENGLHFESGLEANLDALEGQVPVVPVSAGVDVIEASEEEHEGEAESEEEHEHGAFDPHTWQDPQNLVIWTRNIAEALSALDPANASQYESNADSYVEQLNALDATIRQEVERIPEANRKLVTNHDNLAYFARRYGFEIVGTVLIGASEVSEPSAGEIAALVETIRQEQVPAIFVETTINDRLAQVISEEVGGDIQVLTLYTDSLGIPGSGAETYIDLMTSNIHTIAGALGE